MCGRPLQAPWSSPLPVGSRSAESAAACGDCSCPGRPSPSPVRASAPQAFTGAWLHRRSARYRPNFCLRFESRWSAQSTFAWSRPSEPPLPGSSHLEALWALSSQVPDPGWPCRRMLRGNKPLKLWQASLAVTEGFSLLVFAQICNTSELFYIYFT